MWRWLLDLILKLRLETLLCWKVCISLCTMHSGRFQHSHHMKRSGYFLTEYSHSMEWVNIWWYNILTPIGGVNTYYCNIRTLGNEVNIGCYNILTPTKDLNIQCHNIFTPMYRGKDFMLSYFHSQRCKFHGGVNISLLYFQPGVVILYNEFTRGWRYYITSPPGSKNLGEWKYYPTLVPTSQHGTQLSSVPSDLHNSQYVFVRRDCHRSPLEHPYEGPFRVITSFRKVFTIERGGKQENISVDRLKPAHPDFDMPVPTPTPRPQGRPRKRP